MTEDTINPFFPFGVLSVGAIESLPGGGPVSNGYDLPGLSESDIAASGTYATTEQAPQGNTFASSGASGAPLNFNSEAGASGSTWSDIFTGITGVFNMPFPAIYSAVTGKPVYVTPTGTQATGVTVPATAPALTPDKVRNYLLIAGVVVLGVALGMMLFKSKAAL